MDGNPAAGIDEFAVPPAAGQRPEWRRSALPVAWLAILPLFNVVLAICGPFLLDSLYRHSGLGVGLGDSLLPGLPTIDPNFGTTSFALGARAALDLLGGKLPLWNHYEGLGAPLLGEMQSAALFPFTWLLALPHGQIIEQGCLQFVAGLGTYLFFRRFGIRAGAALAGALFFEMNGVFAWLRNAVFNPVAFLPWLLLTIESLHGAAAANLPLARRLPALAGGGLAGGLALYAGFPEEVYLYGLFLAGWVALRLIQQEARLSFLLSLLGVALLILALAAPLLLAFGHFLPEASLDWHGGDGGYGLWLPPAGLLHYMAPYAFGPIFASSNPTVGIIWGGTGGYLGFVPLLLAFAVLGLPGQRGVKLFLAGWVFVALAVSHGMPGVYQAFMMLPLTRIAGCWRYLNASWIFAVLFLAVMFLDALPSLGRPVLRRLLLGAGILGLAALIAAAIGAWPVVHDVLRHSTRTGACLLGACGLLISLALLPFLAASWLDRRRLGLLLSVLLVGEATAWFLLPFLSAPRRGAIDYSVISYLSRHVGYQRVAATTPYMLAPNYGSYFEIPTLNYDDLPAPRRTVAYVRDRLDPLASSVLFLPWVSSAPPEQQAGRPAIFRERLPRYAEAGVKYLLAGPEFNATPAFALPPASERPYALSTGGRLVTTARADQDRPVAGVTLLIGTYDDSANGHLRLTLCSGDGQCANGTADLAIANDNRFLLFPLDRSLQIGNGQDYRITVEKTDGSGAVAVWLFRPSGISTRLEGTADAEALVPSFGFVAANEELPVFSGRVFSIYRLPGTRDYAAADGCRIEIASHDRMSADCDHPSRLVRLEIMMNGWQAEVNGVPTAVATVENTFQAIDLPAGNSEILFTYAPPGVRPAFFPALAALLFCLAVLGRQAVANLRRREVRRFPE